MLNNDDSGLYLDDVQEDAHYHPLPGVTTSLTSSLPSSSLISSPSGLAVDTIVRLTHDDLCLNPVADNFSYDMPGQRQKRVSERR